MSEPAPVQPDLDEMDAQPEMRPTLQAVRSTPPDWWADAYGWARWALIGTCGIATLAAFLTFMALNSWGAALWFLAPFALIAMALATVAFVGSGMRRSFGPAALLCLVVMLATGLWMFAAGEDAAYNADFGDAAAGPMPGPDSLVYPDPGGSAPAEGGTAAGPGAAAGEPGSMTPDSGTSAAVPDETTGTSAAGPGSAKEK